MYQIEADRARYTQDYSRVDELDEAIGIKRRQIAYRKKQAELDARSARELRLFDPEKPRHESERFAMVPRLMRRRWMAGILSPAAVAVYMCLWDMHGVRPTDPGKYVSPDAVAGELGLSRRHVQRVLEELIADHWIERLPAGRGSKYWARPWQQARTLQELDAAAIGDTHVTKDAAIGDTHVTQKENFQIELSESAKRKGKAIHAAVFAAEDGTRATDDDGLPGKTRSLGELLSDD